MGLFEESQQQLPDEANFNTQNQVLPSYYGGADSHNYASGDFAFTDPSTWGEGLSNAGKFIVASAYSGLNSFRNTGVAIGNYFGADWQEHDTGEALSEIDSDLGQYYYAHQQAADVAGFIAGSFIPGMAGVKLLNVGQKALKLAAKTGSLGKNLSNAIGLLRPATVGTEELSASGAWATKAGREMGATQAGFTALNKDVIKSLATSYGQNVLEAAAFQTAATVTMFKSPVLNDTDAGDIVSDIVTSSLEFGTIGTLLDAAKGYGIIRKGIKAADKQEKGVSLSTHLPPKMSSSDHIIQAFEDMENLPSVESQLAGNEIPEQVTKLQRLRVGTIDRLKGDIRGHFQALVGKDNPDLGNHLADYFLGMKASDARMALAGTKEIGRVGDKLALEKSLNKALGTYSGELTAYASPNAGIQFVKLTGEDTGAIVTEAPEVLNLADVANSKPKILAKIADYSFNTREPWNPIASPEGVDHLEAEARYYWAHNIAKVKDGMSVHEYDIPMLEKLWNEMKAPNSEIKSVTLLSDRSAPYTARNAEDLLRFTRNAKEEVSLYLRQSAKAGNNIPHDAIAKIANVRSSWLDGERAENEFRDIFAKQSYQEDYNAMRVQNGIAKVSSDHPDITFLPQYMKVGVDTVDADMHQMLGAAYLDAKSKLVRTGVDNAVADAVGSLYDRLIPITRKHILSSDRFGGGPSGFSAANGNYGSLESVTQTIGAAEADIADSFKKATKEALEGKLIAMSQNQEAAIEYSVVKNYTQSVADHYIPNPDGSQSLIHREYSDYIERMKAGEKNLTPPSLQGGTAKSIIPIKNMETWEVLNAEIKRNGWRVSKEKNVRAAQGHIVGKDERTWHPYRPDPREYTHYAMVLDHSVAGGSVGEKSMIHAADGKTLAEMIGKVQNMGPQYQVLTGNDLKAYFEQKGIFDYGKTLHEPRIDSALKKNGVNSQFLVETNSQKIVENIMNWHIKADDWLARELVNAKYEPEFAALEELGGQYTNIALSKYSGVYKYADNSIKNPYLNYIKTALNVKQTAEYPIWQSVNKTVDSAYSKAHFAVSRIFQEVKNPTDMEKVNAALQKYGMKSAYYDAATNLLANHPAPREALSKFVRGANSVLSTLTLGLDPLNALNNFVGANVLLGAETRNIFKRINQGNSDAVGELAQLKNINIPGMKDTITAPGKIIADAYKEFFGNHLPGATRDSALKSIDDFYTKMGWVPEDISELRAIHSDATLSGAETVKDLDSRMNRLIAKGQKFADWGYSKTGNKYAETTNRWVAARVMQKISDIAVKHKIISSEEQISYINTFVNRTQGNFLASQRPIYFQGPIGNAIGLFQTYQFNMMQQMFRYVAEGNAKDTAMLLGLQGTIYGMNGLPAFNFINTHIVGNLSSNPQHKDLYSGTYGAAGQSVGNWLLYGLPSNLLHTNIYSRGDINPRQVTVIPTNPADVPIINATTSFFGNLKTMMSKVQNGGAIWETILQGVEHNGLSRPLAGLAQIAQEGTLGKVTATSKQGTILGQNDLFALASISRLAGGRPLDEAIMNDAAYRSNSYKATDTARKKMLDQAVKTAVIGGRIADTDQYSIFAAKYAELGGDQKRFNQYMMKQITAANTPQAERIMAQLKSPYAQNMQQIMGGRDLFDQ